MTNKNNQPNMTPKEERVRIGTPAGESPEEGRKRHGTKCLTDTCGPGGAVKKRKLIEDEKTNDELDMEGEELSTTGGVTGTHVLGGTPSGGKQAGGSQTKPAATTAEGRVESRKGKTSA